MNLIVKSILGAVFFLNSCKPQPQSDFGDPEGLIEMKGRIYDSSTRQYTLKDFFPDMKIWYIGNHVVEEIKTIKTSVDRRGNSTHETPIAYYLLIDRDTKKFYHFSSFSDTARLIEQYELSDTSELRGVGGWAFYKDINLESVGPRKYLTDTTINNVVHKRVQINVKEQNNELATIRYMRCDKANTLFRFNQSLSKELGCPIVRIDYLVSPSNQKPLSTEIVFVRDSLSKDERKVFDAWGKKIKSLPMK